MSDLRPEEQRFLQAAFAAGPACLSIEQLAALAAGDLTGDAAQSAQRHVDACPHCMTEFGMLREFETARPAADEAAGVRWVSQQLAGMQLPLPPVREPRRNRIGEWFAGLMAPQYRMAWGAALVLAVAAGLYLRPPQPGRPVFDPSQQVLRSHNVTLDGPAGELALAPAQFRWQKVEGASMYRVRLLDVTGKQLWSLETTETAAEVPSEVRAGHAYKWDVVAQNAAGAVLAESPLQDFHILVTSR